jgi:hypothetical protein
VVLVAAGATGTDGTFLDLTATGGLYASLSGTVKILMGLGDASLTGGINASLGLWGRMTFAGPWNKPHIASTSLSLELTGYYYYAILVNGSPKFDSRTDSQGTTDEEFKLTVF